VGSGFKRGHSLVKSTSNAVAIFLRNHSFSEIETTCNYLSILSIERQLFTSRDTYLVGVGRRIQLTFTQTVCVDFDYRAIYLDIFISIQVKQTQMALS